MRDFKPGNLDSRIRSEGKPDIVRQHDGGIFEARDGRFYVLNPQLGWIETRRPILAVLSPEARQVEAPRTCTAAGCRGWNPAPATHVAFVGPECHDGKSGAAFDVCRECMESITGERIADLHYVVPLPRDARTYYVKRQTLKPRRAWRAAEPEEWTMQRCELTVPDYYIGRRVCRNTERLATLTGDAAEYASGKREPILACGACRSRIAEIRAWCARVNPSLPAAAEGGAK